MNIDSVIGIDPGANGGIVTWKDNHVTAAKMPKDLNELRNYLDYVNEIGKPIIFLEKLSVRPDDVMVTGNNPNMGKLFRIQKMMANYEQLKAIITVCDIPFCMVHPMKWQSSLKLRVKGSHEDKNARKKRYKEIAQKLYPGMKQTLWSSDATLIMHFGRFVLCNDLNWVKSNLPGEIEKKLF